MERLYGAGEPIRISGAVRFEFENSKQFKEGALCAVKKTPWRYGGVLLVQGVLEEAKADSDADREENAECPLNSAPPGCFVCDVLFSHCSAGCENCPVLHRRACF